MEHDERACRALLQRWHREGDRAARDEVAERLLPLAHGLARRYAGKGEPLDDLEQVACVGLLKAIDRFDCARDVRFATFAVPTIAGEIKRHFRDRGWMLRVPRDVQELTARLSRTREDLTRLLGRPPRVEELAASAGASPEQVVEALHAAEAYRAMSLDAPTGEDGPTPAEALGGDDGGFERTEQRLLLAGGLRGPRAAGARDPAPALLRRAHPARDRRARRHQPDARVAPDPPLGRAAARRARRGGRGGRDSSPDAPEPVPAMAAAA